MIVAIWIIAVCEVIRAVQNHIQLMALKKNSDTATQAFVDSLKATDKEFVRDMMKELEKHEQSDNSGSAD